MRFDDSLMLCVTKDVEAGKIPMLLGEPGIGKSSWIENLARLMHTEAFILACNQLADKADLTGARLVPNDDKTSYKQVFYPHAVICDAIDYANQHPFENPILFLDELNRTTPDVTSELLSIPTMRSIGSIKLPKNIRILIAGNDKGNVTSLDEASVSRFVLYHVEPDTNTFLSLDPELNVHVRSVLEANPDVIFCKTMIDDARGNGKDPDDQYIDDIITDDDGMQQLTTPRTISGVSDWLNTMSNDDIRTMMATSSSNDPDAPTVLQEAIEGHVGHTKFAILLLKQIQENISRINNQSAALIIQKPACWDKITAQKTATELEEFVENLTPEERSAALVYAIYDKHPNEQYIHYIAPLVTRLEKTDADTLTKLSANGKLNETNLHSFYDTGTDLANLLSQLIY